MFARETIPVLQMQKVAMKTIPALTAALAALSLIPVFADTLPPDLKPLALEVYGVRGAYATDASTVRVVIGASAGESRDHIAAYHITSEDDPAYAYEKFVSPSAATVVETLDEFPFPEGFDAVPLAKEPLNRYTIDLKLPAPLKPGCHYGVVAQGDGNVLSSGKAGAEFSGTPGEVKLPADAFAARIVGLRRVSNIGDGKLLLEFGAGYSVPGGNDLANYAVTVNGQARPALAMGRRTKIDVYRFVGWPWKTLLQNDVFLDIGEPLRAGDKVAVKLDPKVTAGNREDAFAFDPATSLTRSVQVNQVGYLPDSLKVGYVGCWMASFPDGNAIGGGDDTRDHSDEYASLAPFALRLEEAPAFHVIDVKTGKSVWDGKAALRANGRDPDCSPSGVRWRLSSSNVYTLDFSEFKTPGRYRLSVDGLGCSFDFAIAEDVYLDAFRKQATGVYAQRCGCELDPKYADGWRRIACHKNGLTASTVKHHAGGSKDSDFRGNLDFGPDGMPRTIQAFGGHHDAGDFNPRGHIEIAETLLDIYELFPQKFYDGQLGIPEAGNGIPDIVDEALWAVRLWVGLQDADGGVFNGTESQGDPGLTDTVERDKQGDFAFAKDAQGSFYAAGAFAKCARILKGLGRAKPAAEFLDRARRAYAWGVGHKPEEKYMSGGYNEPRAYAAAELFHTTGEEEFQEDFRASTPWGENPEATLRVDNTYDHLMGAMAYTLIPRDKADAALWDAALNALRKEVGMYIWGCNQRDYPFLTHPYVPVFWGFAAYEHFAIPAAHLYGVTHERNYFDWLVRTCDNTLGANALNLSWVTGIGTQTIRAPLHGSRYRPGGFVITGMQAEGPVFNSGFVNFSYADTVYPALRTDFATYHNFADNHFCIEMDEGMSRPQAQTMAVFGILCPDHK